MASKLILTGDKKLNRRLNRLKLNLGKKIARKAGRKALRPVRDQARKDSPKKTGTLRKSIKIRSIKRSRFKFGARVTTGNRSGNFSGKAFYGGFINYGWTPGKRGSGKRGKPVKGTRFLNNAAEKKKRAALAIYKIEIRSGIIRETTSG